MSDSNGMETRLIKVEAQISVHEAVCAERYKNILENASDMKRGLLYVNSLIFWVGGALICGMASILIQLIFFGD